jgi:hypothetical protein
VVEDTVAFGIINSNPDAMFIHAWG